MRVRPAGRGLWAIAVRIRQELTKRVEVWWRRLNGSVRIHLLPASPPLMDGAVSPIERLEHGFFGHLMQSRESSGPDDAGAIVVEADAYLEGDFRVFGRTLPGFERTGNWRADPVTGQPIPARPWFRYSNIEGTIETDVKVFWELNRHHCLLRLAQAFFLTGEDRYVKRLRELLDGWIEQDVPGIGLNWGSTLEVAIRATAWCWSWALTARSDIWDEAFTRRFMVRLRAHAFHIYRYDSTHYSPNTHLTGEALGLLYVAETFPDMRGSSMFRKKAVRTLCREAKRQILPDGMHFELSTGYHRYTLEFYLHFHQLIRHSDVRLATEIKAVLGKLCSAAECLRGADGSWPVLGDEDGGRFLRLSARPPSDMGALLNAAKAILLNESGTHASDGEEGWWLAGRGPGTSANAAEEVEVRTSLPSAGYLVGRGSQARREWYVLVDAGPLGALSGGHGHADLSHLEIGRDRKMIVSDSGCGVYGADPDLRSWFRSERAHARPALQGFSLAVEGGPFSWKRQYGQPESWHFDYGGVWHAALRYGLCCDKRKIQHLRHVVLFKADGLIVIDWFHGHGLLSGSVRWPLATEDAVVDSAGGVTTAGVRIDTRGISHQVEVEPGRLEVGFRAPTYGDIREGKVMDVPFNGSLPCGIITTFSVDPLLSSTVLKDDYSLQLRLQPYLGGDQVTASLAPTQVPVINMIPSHSDRGGR